MSWSKKNLKIYLLKNAILNFGLAFFYEWCLMKEFVIIPIFGIVNFYSLIFCVISDNVVVVTGLPDESGMYFSGIDGTDLLYWLMIVPNDTGFHFCDAAAVCRFCGCSATPLFYQFSKGTFSHPQYHQKTIPCSKCI
jgi:hypothetical protein